LATDGNGNDTYALRVLPTGVFSPSDKAFSWLGEVAYFWHGNDASGPVAFIRYFRNGQRNVGKDRGAKTMGFSVRCVAD
jgi:uncharacterized protein (TIGR02145 family)